MQAFTLHTGVVAPMDRENVDTDAIIPKQFLKSIKRTGFGPNLFDEWRYRDPGYPGQDPATRVPNPDFVLNQPRYQGASVLLARRNFGCGSSREHAPWALEDYGFQAILAPSFADIFRSNCMKIGLLPVELAPEECAAIAQAGQAQVDLAAQEVRFPDGSREPFEVDPFRKQCLIEGIDEIALTLRHEAAIVEHEARMARDTPWLFESAR